MTFDTSIKRNLHLLKKKYKLKLVNYNLQHRKRILIFIKIITIFFQCLKKLII